MELTEIKALIHDSRAEGRAIQRLYALRDKISESVHEDKKDSQMYQIRKEINCILTLLEYRI